MVAASDGRYLVVDGCAQLMVTVSLLVVHGGCG